MSDKKIRDAGRKWIADKSAESALAFVQAALQDRPELALDLAPACWNGVKRPHPRPEIDWALWKADKIPEERVFNLPAAPGDAQDLPHGVHRAQVIWAQFMPRRPEHGGGLRLRLKLGFCANGQRYMAWTAISQDNSDMMLEFVTAACPWLLVDEDEFTAKDAVGRFLVARIGFGVGNWAELGPDPRVVVQGYAEDAA